MELEITNVNAPKLMDEFCKANIRVIKANVIDENTYIFEFEENQDEVLINNIVKNHNPAVVQVPVLEERIKALEDLLLEVL